MGSAFKGATPTTALTPMHVWALQGPPCLVVSLLYAASVESVPAAIARLTWPVVLMILCTCVTATCLNLMAMFMIKAAGGNSMQIIGMLNVVLIVAISVGV